MNFLFHKEKWGSHGLKDFVITRQKLSLFPEPEYNFLLLGCLDLLGEAALNSDGVLVFKFKGWPSRAAQNACQVDSSSFVVSIGIFSLKNLGSSFGLVPEQQLFL